MALALQKSTFGSMFIKSVVTNWVPQKNMGIQRSNTTLTCQRPKSPTTWGEEREVSKALPWNSLTCLSTSW